MRFRLALQKVLQRTLEVFGWTLFALSTVVLVALSLLAFQKQMVTGVVSRVLGSVFEGSIEITAAELIALDRVEGVDAILRDPEGRVVAELHDVKADLPLLDVVDQLVHRTPTLTLEFERVHARYARVDLSADARGQLRLVDALTPPDRPKKRKTSSQEVVVRLHSIVFERAWVHGAPSADFPLDVGVQNLSTALFVEGEELTIGPARVRADARVVGPVRQVHVDFRGRSRLDIAVQDQLPTSDAPQIPPVLEEVHFSATLDQDESHLELSGNQVAQRLSLAIRGTYVPSARLLPTRPVIEVNTNVEGTLNDLRARVRLQADDVESRLDMTSIWGDELVLQGTWTIDDFSPTLINESVEASEVDSSLQFEARRSRVSRLPEASASDPEWAHWHARLDGRFSAFALEGKEVPALEVSGRFSPPQWYARLQTAGRGRTRVVVQGELDRDLPPERLNVSGRIDLAELGPYLPGLRKGTGTIDVSGRFLPVRSEVSAQVQLDVRGVQYQNTVAAEKLSARGKISGSIRSPRVRASARVEELDLFLDTPQERHFDEVNAHWSGDFFSSQLQVTAEQKERKIQARTQLRLLPRFEAERTQVVLRGEGEPIYVSAGRLDTTAGRVRIEDVTFTGIGEGNLSGTVRRNSLTLKGYVRDVPLEEIAERFSVDLEGARGKVDLDADFTLGPGKAEGRIRLIVVEAGVRQGPSAVRAVPLLDVHLDVVGEGRNLVLVTEITPTRSPDSVARIEATVDAMVPDGAPLQNPRAFLDGILRVKTRGTLDLAWIPAALLPKHTDLRGQLDFRARLHRPDPNAVPSARIFVRTSGLQAAFPQEGHVEGQQVAMRTITGLDFKTQISHLPERGLTRAWLGIYQEQRMLGHVRGRVDATLTSLRFPQALRGYREARMEVHAHLLRTPLDGLPEVVRVEGTRGFLSTTVHATGSFARPVITGNAELQDFWTDHSREQERLDGRLSFEYADRVGQVELRIIEADDSDAPQNLLVSSEAHFNEEITLAPLSLERVDARIRLREFPVGSFLPSRAAEGSLSGDIDIERYGTKNPKLEANLDLARLAVGEVPLEGGRLRANADADSAAVFVHFQGDDYLLRADVKTRLAWNSPYVPTVDEGATGRLVARKFPLRTLRPLVNDALADLDGKLDAQLQGRMKEGAPVMSGRVVLSEGSVQFPRLGQQLRDAHAEVLWSEAGRVTLKNASFRGVTGRATVEGKAKMDGFFPESAEFRVQVDRTERLPLSIQGLGLGEFWGDVRATVNLSTEERRVDTNVHFREFQVVFPEIVTGGVQSLKPDEYVSAGAWVNEEEFVVVPLQPVEEKKKDGETWSVRTKVDLGNEFWIQQGPRRRIQVGGELLVQAEEEVSVEGQLSLARGRIELNGRMFEIDEGTITFQPEDPGNPIIVAEARWQAPEGIVVIARFLGPVQSGEMTLTSEPPLPKDQIVSLLLFGDTAGLNGATDSSGGNNEAQAIVVGGSVATQGLNQALSRVEAIDISTRLDTAESDAVRPEVVIQLTNSVSAQVGYNLEEPSPGESPDRTVVSLEVRLRGGNSVSATLGDRGSAFFDWVWRYRY